MYKLLFRKWWVVLVQGVLLLLISLFIFRNPATVLTSISIWVGLLIMISGLIGIFASLYNDHSDHKLWSVLWSALSAVFGFLLLINVLVTMKAITILFGLWLIFGGIRFIASGWIIRSKDSLGWVVIISGVLSIIAAFMIMTNMGTGAIGVSILLGTLVLIKGIALIVLSLIKKKIGHALDHKIEQLKAT